MGVDFYTCDDCHDTFPDCGSYFGCDYCNNMLCDECARKHKAGFYADFEDGDDGSDGHCPFCEGEVVSDDDLLSFAMLRMGVTYEELVVLYKAAHNA